MRARPLDELINDRRGRDDRDKANKSQSCISRHVPLSIVHDISSRNGNRENRPPVPIRRDGVLPHSARQRDARRRRPLAKRHAIASVILASPHRVAVAVAVVDAAAAVTAADVVGNMLRGRW